MSKTFVYFVVHERVLFLISFSLHYSHQQLFAFSSSFFSLREGRLLTGRYSFDKLSDDCRYGAECNGIPGLGDVSLLFLFQSRDGLILQSVPDHRSLGE